MSDHMQPACGRGIALTTCRIAGALILVVVVAATLTESGRLYAPWPQIGLGGLALHLLLDSARTPAARVGLVAASVFGLLSCAFWARAVF